MTREPTAFAPSPQRDPHGRALRQLLELDDVCGRAHRRRARLQAVLAATSLPVWLLSVLPGSCPPRLRAATLAAWIVVFGGTLAAAAREWALARRRERCARSLPPPGSTHP